MKTYLRNRVISVSILAVACLLISTSASAQAFHDTKRIVYLFNDSRECTFFQLQGVAVADPALPAAGVWFALSTSHPNYKQNYAVLLSSKLGSGSVHVNTTGRFACGLAEVDYVAIP